MNGKESERDFYNGNVITAKVFVNYMQLGFAMDFSCLPHASHFFSLYENVVPGKNGNHFVFLSPSHSPSCSLAATVYVWVFIQKNSDKNPIQLPSLQHFNHIALNEVCSCRLHRFLSRRSLNAPLSTGRWKKKTTTPSRNYFQHFTLQSS